MIDNKQHEIGVVMIAEVIRPDFILSTVQDGIDLVWNLSYQGYDGMIIGNLKEKSDIRCRAAIL
jgi:hypothetical protein